MTRIVWMGMGLIWGSGISSDVYLRRDTATGRVLVAESVVEFR